MAKSVETTVRARRLELVDSAGKVRVVIGPDKKQRYADYDVEKYYTMEFLDRNGGRLAMFRCSDEGFAFLEVGGDRSWSYAVEANRDRFPSVHGTGPDLLMRDRVANKPTLLRALRGMEERVALMNTTRWANQVRRHVAEQCTEFGVDVPDWAVVPKKQRRRSVVVS